MYDPHDLGLGAVYAIFTMTRGLVAMAIKAVGNEQAMMDDLLSLVGDNLDNLVNITTKGYADVAEILGWKTAMEMYFYFRGSTINCAMSFFTKEYVVAIASKCKDKRERERIARICGYTSQTIERAVRELNA